VSVTAGWETESVVYRSSNRTVYSARYHRRRVLVGPVEDRLKEIIAQGSSVVAVMVRLHGRRSAGRTSLVMGPDLGGASLEVVRRYVENHKWAA
jgi:hypothetical protein